jgi:uncharacterized hydrophobic protein (TIGR00271 family)
MNNPNQPTVWRDRFSLMTDKAPNEEVERRIREGVEISGANAWILIFAIFTASIGLNVNSTAVIIGAMLISPLMGPIMGIGHGVAIHDFALVRKSLLNLGIAALISLCVSALYFVITPLSEAQSELLARTSPTIWDVLIALFGGLAGIVGVTRAERSNVIPGVAIATALMPPLCTAGYGIATGQPHFFLGAFYLFSINGVFIALATFIGIRLVKQPKQGFVDARVELRIKRILWVVALATALPSAYLALQLVQNEVFKERAKAFVKREFVLPQSHVADVRTDPVGRSIEVTVIGQPIPAPELAAMRARLAKSDISTANLIVHQAGEASRIDIGALRTRLVSDLYRDAQDTIARKDKEIAATRAELAAEKSKLAAAEDIAEEARAQIAQTAEVVIGRGYAIDGNGEKRAVMQLTVKTARPLPNTEQSRLKAWFVARTKTDQVSVTFDTLRQTPSPKMNTVNAAKT